MYHVLNNCAGAGGNGNGLNMNRKLIYEFFPPPAPRSNAFADLFCIDISVGDSVSLNETSPTICSGTRLVSITQICPVFNSIYSET